MTPAQPWSTQLRSRWQWAAALAGALGLGLAAAYAGYSPPVAVGLMLGGLGAVILARRHLLAPAPMGAGRSATSSFVSEPALEFIEPPDIHGA